MSLNSVISLFSLSLSFFLSFSLKPLYNAASHQVSEAGSEWRQLKRKLLDCIINSLCRRVADHEVEYTVEDMVEYTFEYTCVEYTYSVSCLASESLSSRAILIQLRNFTPYLLSADNCVHMACITVKLLATFPFYSRHDCP